MKKRKVKKERKKQERKKSNIKLKINKKMEKYNF